MDIIIDGSYIEHAPDTVGCGVITMDKFGFYTEHRFESKHIAASSSFAEWYGLECAFNLIANDALPIQIEEEVHIYTDCLSIMDVMSDRKGIQIKNTLLNAYVTKVAKQFLTLPLSNASKYYFHHVKYCAQEEQIVKLHQRAHDTAQVVAPVPTTDTMHPVPDKVYLQLKLEPTAHGRQWNLYENDMHLYKGKLRTILRKYQKDRHDIQQLSSQKRLSADKGTRRLLRKYIGRVQL